MKESCIALLYSLENNTKYPQFRRYLLRAFNTKFAGVIRKSRPRKRMHRVGLQKFSRQIRPTQIPNRIVVQVMRDSSSPVADYSWSFIKESAGFDSWSEASSYVI